MPGKKKHLRHAITADLYVETLRKSFDNSRQPKALYFGIKIKAFLCGLTFVKIEQMLCKQSIRIKGGMQTTAIFQK